MRLLCGDCLEKTGHLRAGRELEIKDERYVVWHGPRWHRKTFYVAGFRVAYGLNN